MHSSGGTRRESKVGTKTKYPHRKQLPTKYPHRKQLPTKMVAATVVPDSPKPADEIENVKDLLQLENSVWEMQDLLLQMTDEVESGEPLQGKQTYQNILVRVQSIGEYLNAPDE